MISPRRTLNRRTFLGTTGAAAVAFQAGIAAGRSVSLAADAQDPVVGAPSSQWALGELAQALTGAGVDVNRCSHVREARSGDLCIVASGADSKLGQGILKPARVTIPAVPEALALAPGTLEKRNVLLACGHDARGLTYALLELADRAKLGADPMTDLTSIKPVAERPANKVRSMMRMFTSDVEDKGWYNDREMWPQYLSMLAAQRFNRFQLAFGIGYDFIRQVTDAYFLFTYPFMLSVPGYNVRSPQLPDAERDANLAMLQYISEQTVARGMEFQLGLWMHGYEWIDSPHPNYTTEGVTKENHGPYCRDAVRLLLQKCPAVSGVTFRVHGESGVEEGSYDFWKTVFDGVATCGRKVEIDMHPKGMNQTMLDIALQTRQPVKVSPKFWAEHMGMTYHQADIRELEQPKANKGASALMKFSAGSRSFLRYGYGDLMREDRKWGVVHRIWPGTQRLLLWGDPTFAKGYSRAFQFCGSDGVDICEPLSFKGRRGSGIAGDRCAYQDDTLRPRWDWQKYEYATRVWGRCLYNPDCEPDVWERYSRKQWGDNTNAAVAALASASRILPIITTAHGASAGNNSYWPEVYTNQSLVNAKDPKPYTDSPAPKVFGNVSPLDPQLFYRINDFADDLVSGKRNGRYSPVEVATWIESYAANAADFLAKTGWHTGTAKPEQRRLLIDLKIQTGLGNFFGAKFRSGMLYRIYEKTGDRRALEASLDQYRKARAAWAELAEGAKSVYMSDITVGEHPWLRGHWLDRLPAIDRDIALIEEKLGSAASGEADPKASAAISHVLSKSRRQPNCTHTPPATLRSGQALALELTIPEQASAVRLYYRHVDQAERFQIAEMETHGARGYRATLPASYTDSPYPLQYYFEIQQAPDQAFLYPGFSLELTNQPYFVVRKA